MALKVPASTPGRGSMTDTSMRLNDSHTGHRPGHKRGKHELRVESPKRLCPTL